MKKGFSGKSKKNAFEIPKKYLLNTHTVVKLGYFKKLIIKEKQRIVKTEKEKNRDNKYPNCVH